MKDNEHENEQQDDLAAEAKTDEATVPVEELEEQLELAKVEIERLADQSLRRQAELINYRRRVQKEQAATVTMAQVALLGGIVPVIDDLERAVETRSEDASVYHEGMQIILRSVQKVLETIGVERIMPEGLTFDPRYHESIARHETNEVPEGQVLDVVQPGYRLKDRLIRPASVVVSCGSTTVEGDTAEDNQGKGTEADAAVLDGENGVDDA